MDLAGGLSPVGTKSLGSRDGHIECEAMVLQGYSINVQERMRWQEMATDIVQRHRCSPCIGMLAGQQCGPYREHPDITLAARWPPLLPYEKWPRAEWH
jgi:hypothetical protein